MVVLKGSLEITESTRKLILFSATARQPHHTRRPLIRDRSQFRTTIILTRDRTRLERMALQHV